MNNESEKPENFLPQDSKRKNVKNPKDDNEAVVKAKDKIYTKDEAEFDNPSKRRETDEQPVNSVKIPAKD
ncbi:hypothetical protein [Daejeonella lutea]|uniref:Uncharacterized protein n=1 Tax=Daejeonella lutea TaxID=572036 RepID=A0A1T5F0L5_9SPHI|nr:hypothetical protein [Daejeonella lutea]SKB89747.1 hypothetical protein SAMN05661099_3368 [Daejeonella lutea]